MAIILASRSPRRQELLRRVGLSDYTLAVSEAKEVADLSQPPARIVQELARRKAAAADPAPGDIVIAADTVVVLDGEILGKPKDRADAVRMLTRLSGRGHEVFTGLALLKNGAFVCGAERTEVFFRPLTPAEIESYAATGEPDDKAGAYGVQDRGALFVRKIVGDYYNVMGLPLCLLSGLLKSLGVNLLTGEGLNA